MNRNWIIILLLIVSSSFVSATWFSPKTPPPVVINVTDIPSLSDNNTWYGDNIFLNVTIINQSILNVNGSICLNETCINNWDELTNLSIWNYNQTLAALNITDILYADINWGYNQTLATLNITDISYANIIWGYNQTLATLDITNILYADIIWGYNQTLDTLNITDENYVPYTGADKTINLNTQALYAGHINATTGLFDELNVSNSTLYIGTVKLSSSGNNNLSINDGNGNITARFYYGSGRFLTDINLSNVNGTSVFGGDVIINGNLTVDINGYINSTGPIYAPLYCTEEGDCYVIDGFILKSGDNMSGDLNMGNNSITNVSDMTAENYTLNSTTITDWSDISSNLIITQYNGSILNGSSGALNRNLSTSAQIVIVDTFTWQETVDYTMVGDVIIFNNRIWDDQKITIYS